MRIYLGQNGEKTGPYPVWELRTRLEKGELSPDTLAWHEGCAGWTPLRDLPALGWQRPPEDGMVESEPEDDPEGDRNELINPDLLPLEATRAYSLRPRPWARWWARWFDLGIWFLLSGLVLRLFGLSLSSMAGNVWIYLACQFAIIPAEAACLALWGTTPGKWLLGLRVTRADGSRLSYSIALQRSFWVLVLGNALNIFIYPMVTWIGNYFLLTSRRTTWWDNRLRTQVVSRPRGRLGVLPYVTALLALNLCAGILFPDSVAEAETQVRQMMEQLKRP